MGCDIHDYAEVREGDKWTKVGKVFSNPYYDPSSTDGFHDKKTEHPFRNRDYDVFAILAGVRDYRDDTPCIAADRGLPADVSKAVKKQSDAFGVDGHSHTWVGLDEILAFDWNQTVEDVVHLDANEYIFHKAGKLELDHLKWHDPFHELLLSREHMDALIRVDRDTWPQLLVLLGGKPNSTPVMEFKYKTPLTKLAKDFLRRTVSELKKLGKPENVRMVFWFDN